MIDLNILDDDTLLYEYLQTLDYDKLDYSDINNLFFIEMYIKLKDAFGYDDYYDLLEILKNNSLISYYYFLNDFYPTRKKILELTPINIIENIKYKIVSEADNLKNINKDIKTKTIDEIKLYINNLTINNCLLNKYFNNKLDYLSNNYNKEPTYNDIRYIIKYNDYHRDIFNYNKCLECLEILKDNKIVNKDYLFFMELFLVSLINNKIDVDILLESYNKIYYSNNIREIYIFHKYKIINKIIYIINRLEDIDEKKTQITKIYKLYEQYKKDDCLDDDILSWPIFISLEYLLYGLLSNVETNKDISYKYIEKSINVILKVKKLNLYPNKIIDIIILYSNMKNYKKAIEYYDMYKDCLLDKLKDNSVYVKVYAIIIKCYIHTHQIQNIDDLYLLLKNIEFNKYFYKEKQMIEFYTKLIKDMNYLVSHKRYNFNLIYNYDLINDEKCIRDCDNKIMCMICLENIEQDKITLIECNKCNKYIGHILCVFNYITHNKGRNIKCFNCQQ